LIEEVLFSVFSSTMYRTNEFEISFVFTLDATAFYYIKNKNQLSPNLLVLPYQQKKASQSKVVPRCQVRSLPVDHSVSVLTLDIIELDKIMSSWFIDAS
jgi:hypothetical protein